MPTYDYRCEANGKTVEVRHAMSERLHTWGEVCARLGIEPGSTAPAAPVHKVITGGNVVHKENLGSGQAPPCETGMPCCGGGMCRN